MNEAGWFVAGIAVLGGVIAYFVGKVRGRIDLLEKLDLKPKSNVYDFYTGKPVNK